MKLVSNRRGRAIALGVGLAIVGSYGFVQAASGNVQNTLTPCRLVDTRSGSTVGLRSTPIGAGETVTIKVVGSNGNCVDVASDTTSVEVQLTASETSTPSFLTAYPADLTTRPVISQLNTRPGVVISNTTNVALSATGEFKLYNEVGSSNVIIDVLGTFRPSEDGGTPGPVGPSGPAGPAGSIGPAGPAAPGTFGPVRLTDQPDRACADEDPQEVWALTDSDRHFVVQAAQDGSGYIVTRYDTNGTFESVDGANFPACGDAGTFTGEGSTGTWSGVWTRKVVMTAGLDYDPDAVLPATATWNDLFTLHFGLDVSAVDPATLSYEFDYYNDCGDQWRDAFYDDTYEGSGNIENCTAP